jgi:hypothetical protein
MSTDMQMYGVEDINVFFEQTKESCTYQLVGGFMVVAGLMSDAQECMAFGDVEQARQFLNLAKYLQFKIAAGELKFAREIETATY